MSSSNNNNNSVTLKTSSNEDINNNSNKTVTLKSSDGETFEVEVSIISQSQTIKQLIEDDCAGEFIPLPNVEGKVLAQVIEYFKIHNKSAEATDEKTKKEIHAWDIEFMNKIDTSSMFALILAANYLDNKGLLDLTAQRIADFIKDKTVEEVRELFNLEYDFAPGEEAELKRKVGEIQ